MSVLKKILAGSAGLAAVVGLASPAAAQYYPNNGYGYNYGYNNNVGNAVGQAINGVIAATQYGNYPYGNYGYGQTYGYGLNANTAVDQCARAVQGRYGARVTGIRNIEPRNNGALRVNGFVSTYTGYGYGNPNQTFSCKVDRYARITDLRIDRYDNRYGYNNYGYRGW